jgi:hypothetical protein
VSEKIFDEAITTIQKSLDDNRRCCSTQSIYNSVMALCMDTINVIKNEKAQESIAVAFVVSIIYFLINFINSISIRITASIIGLGCFIAGFVLIKSRMKDNEKQKIFETIHNKFKKNYEEENFELTTVNINFAEMHKTIQLHITQ